MNITNNHAQRGFHADSETFTELIVSNDRLKAQLAALSDAVEEYDRYCDHVDGKVTELGHQLVRSQGQTRQMEALLENERKRPVWPRERVVKYLAIVCLAGLTVGVLGGLLVGAQRGQAVRTPVTVSRVAPAAPPVTLTLSPSPTQLAVQLERMPCEPGSYLVQLGIYHENESEKAAGKKDELVDLANRMDVNPQVLHLTDVAAACTNIKGRFTKNPSDIVVWAGPVADYTASRAFCKELGFDPSSVIQCYPRALL